MDPMMEQKNVEIESLKTNISHKDKQVKVLETKVNKLTKGLNDLEQYGRRQNLRLNNVPLDEDADCEVVVIDIINRALPEGESISAADIDRCHPLGRPNKKNNRQVMIKFKTYKTKAQVYEARFNLSNVYMSEDFTPTNQKVIDELVKCKKSKRVKSFWSIDGKIFAKAHESQPKARINTIEDIKTMITAAIEEGYMNAEQAEQAQMEA